MSNLNGMGPQGKGPMTGHGDGWCAGGYPRNDLAGRGMGRRQRRRGGGFGFGGRSSAFGYGRRFTDAPDLQSEETAAPSGAGETATEQRRALKAERNRLKAMLREVEATLQTLGAPGAPQE